MIKTCILSIGSELLEGSVLDTNANFLAKNLSNMGLTPACVRQIGDDKDELVNVIKDYADKYHIIFTTGGLGPTFDDLTSECVCLVAGVEWKRNETAFLHMKAVLEKAGVNLRPTHHRQANLPEGCILFHNYSGTALGFGVKIGDALIISMPGVPSEMKTMFLRSIAPFLETNFPLQTPYKKEVHFANVPESEVDRVIIGLNIPQTIQCIINAGKGEVVVKFRGKDEIAIDELSQSLASTFPENFIGFNDTSLASALINLLKEKTSTIAFAESCTGGLISKLMTDVSGVSEVFLGSVVSYANLVKENVLKVEQSALNFFGAVSPDVALQMAEGVMRLTGSNFGLSVTGIAGPTGGTDEKPVGTVFIAAVTDGRQFVKKFAFRGERDDIRTRAANVALYSAFAFINGYTND